MYSPILYLYWISVREGRNIENCTVESKAGGDAETVETREIVVSQCLVNFIS